MLGEALNLSTFLMKYFPRRLLGFSRLVHTQRAIRLTFWASLICAPWILPRRLLGPALSGHRIIVMNQAGLGHSICEFLTIREAASTGRLDEPVTVFYLKGCEADPHLPVLFEKWHQLASAIPSVELTGLRCSSWLTLAAWATRYGKETDAIVPSSPNFRGFLPLQKTLSTSLFERPDLTGTGKKFKRLVESDGGFALLGIRDGGYYNDPTTVRNSPVELYKPTVDHLLAMGVPVIRAGRRSRQRMYIDHENFYDYTAADFQTEEFDLFLMANARFGIGDNFGLTDAVCLFGSPIFVATFPLSPLHFVSHPDFYFATQRLVKVDGGAHVRLDEIVEVLNSGVNLPNPREMERRGFTTQDLDPIAVLEGTKWFLQAIQNSGQPASPEPISNKWAWDSLDRLNRPSIQATNPMDWSEFRGQWWPESLNHLR